MLRRGGRGRRDARTRRYVAIARHARDMRLLPPRLRRGEHGGEHAAARYPSLAECVEAQDSDIFIEWLYLFADDRWWVRAWDGDGFYRLADVLSAVEQASAGRARRRRRLPLITRRDDLKELMDGHGVRPRVFTGHRPPLEHRPPERAAPPCPPLPGSGEVAANTAGESAAERAARERTADRAARRRMRIGRSADSRAHARRRESRPIGGAQAPNPPSD